MTSQADLIIMMNYCDLQSRGKSWDNVPRVWCHIIQQFNVKMIIEAIAGPVYNIIKIMMKGPNNQSNNSTTALIGRNLVNPTVTKGLNLQPSSSSFYCHGRVGKNPYSSEECVDSWLILYNGID